MAFRISRVVCILGRPLALGGGRWDSRQLHSASERSVWYAFLMLGILPSERLRTPFQTVSWRSSQTSHLRRVGEALAGSVVATDTASVDADCYNGITI